MIIVEGTDNTGKSTLCKMLADDLRLPVKHSVRPSKEASELEVLGHSNDQLRPEPVIRDRIYAISEHVNGRVIRGKTALGESHYLTLLDLYCRNYLIIYCRPDEDTIIEDNGRDQMTGVVENHRDLIKGYDDLMEEISTFANVICFDWKRDSYQALLRKCNNYMSEYYQMQHSSLFVTKYKKENCMLNQEKVSQFNENVLKFKRPDKPQLMKKEDIKLSLHQLREEIDELEEAYNEGDLPKLIDALIDLEYFQKGILHKSGIPKHLYDKMFGAVHRANMNKKVGTKKTREGYDSKDAIKPRGWQAPEMTISDMLKAHND